MNRSSAWRIPGIDARPSTRAVDLDVIVSARRLGGRDQFHRHLFEVLIDDAWRRLDVAPSETQTDSLIDVLARWVLEAPVRDRFGVLRLLAVRRNLRAIVGSTGLPFDRFLKQTLALRDVDLSNPGLLVDWKRSKLAALGDASFLSKDSLEAWSGCNALDAQLAAITALDVSTLDADLAAAAGAVGRWLADSPLLDLPREFMVQMQESAFHVSYLADPGRHRFKRAIVDRAARVSRSWQPAAQSFETNPRADRPRLTIVGELLFPGHAMFRCYEQALAGLKAVFDVTLLADQWTRCTEHSGFSDTQVYFVPHERDLGRLVHLVESTRPDILLYPSIGMSYWTFTLSLLRLAPLQLMSVGHPAPSCSDVIDGTLLYRELVLPEVNDYGPLLAYDVQPLPSVPCAVARSRERSGEGDLIVAVNAAGMKLNAPFLDLLGQVLDTAPSGTKLHFFPNAGGAEMARLRQELRAWFPAAVVHATTRYDDYMIALSKADLLLQSFPFGGTNTAIDALALGIPMVCLRGDDLPALVDPVLLGHAGLGGLCASSPADYLRLASRLLNDRGELARASDAARSALSTLRCASIAGTSSMADVVLQSWQARSRAH